MIDEILRFSKTQGGHIGFKELKYDFDKEAVWFTDVSILSNGSIGLINMPDGHVYKVGLLRLVDRSEHFLKCVLGLINENKFL